MDDENVLDRINALANEERELYSKESGGEVTMTSASACGKSS
jgi:hypothetical protein